MNWFLLALLAPATYAVNNFLDKYLLEAKIPDYRSLPVFTTILALFVGSIFWLTGGLVEISFISTALITLTGVFTIWAFALYLEALIIEETSRIIVFFQITPVFVLILSYLFLGETISLQQLVGFLMIIASAIFISLKKENKKFKFSKAFIYIIAADVMWAIPFILIKSVEEQINFKDLLVYESFGIVLGGVVLYLFIGKIRTAFLKTIKKVSKGTLAVIFINECIYLTAKLMSYLALLFGPATLISILGSTQIFFGLIYGSILTFYFPKIFKEGITKKDFLKKALLGIIAFTGIILVS